MRLLVLLLFVSLGAFSQKKSFDIVFAENGLSAQQKKELSNFIDSQVVEQVMVSCFVSQKGAVSKNRIAMEYQMQSMKGALKELGVQANRIKVRPFNLNDSIALNRIQLQFSFKDKLGDKVLSKTAKFQVSEKDIPARPKPKKKKEYVPKLLNYEQFKEGELVRIPNLIFRAGTTDWLDESRDALVELYNVMKYRPNLKVELQGHVCCDWAVGGPSLVNDSYCLELSEGRAESVYNFLVVNGIDKSRVSYKGFGAKKKLKDDRKSAEAAKLNRRVEVFVVSE